MQFDNKLISRNSLPNLVVKNESLEKSYKNLAKKYYDESNKNVNAESVKTIKQLQIDESLQ